MKRLFIALAIFAAAVFTSCNREKESGYVPQKNGIAFYLQGISTKSAETTPQTGLIELDKQSGLIIEESVVSLDDDWYYEPMTKGSPAYTENVASLYGSFNAVAPIRLPTASSASSRACRRMSLTLSALASATIWTGALSSTMTLRRPRRDSATCCLPPAR